MTNEAAVPSRYNHLVTVTRADGARINVLSNLLFGASSTVDDELFEAFRIAEVKEAFPVVEFAPEVVGTLLKSGYLFNNRDEEPELVQRLGAEYGNRDEIAVGLEGGQYGFITSLNCNLACPYCFQQNQADSLGFLSRRQVDLGIDAISAAEERVRELGGKPTLPKISITGGEPLLPSRANVDVLDYLIQRLVDLGWPFNITTNGTQLRRFVERHEEVIPQCRNIQVTLDGPREIHDLRRAFRGGQPSFDVIADGVDAALSAGWKITLRVNLDVTNVSRLHELGTFMIDRRWSESSGFSAYVSPVTDHGSAAAEGALNEAHLLSALLAEVKERPWIRDAFEIKHFRGFNYVEQMLVAHEPRFPVMFRCEAISGMYIFDPSGSVHVCLETVGQEHRRVGTYDPEFVIDPVAARAWSDRNVLQMSNCADCRVRFVCAGGCAQDAFNSGQESACMPFLDEMDIAWQFFATTQPSLFDD
jgi:uncharacterized protein